MKKFILGLVTLALLSSGASATTRTVNSDISEKSVTVQNENVVVESVESQIETDEASDLYYDHVEIESQDSEPQFESELESL